MTILDDLQRTRDETLGYFDLSVEELERSYSPGKWSVRWILHHLSDAETVLLERIRRVLSEPRQVLWAFDQDAWAAGLDYQQRPLDLSRGLYDAARSAVLHEVSRHYESRGDLQFVHSDTGVRTLRDEMDKVAWHNEQHLEQIRQAVGQRG